jgi:hypothetical protein
VGGKVIQMQLLREFGPSLFFIFLLWDQKNRTQAVIIALK